MADQEYEASSEEQESEGGFSSCEAEQSKYGCTVALYTPHFVSEILHPAQFCI